MYSSSRESPKFFHGWTHYHCSTFVLTFLGYAILHATRKTFSNVKATMSDIWTPTPHNDTADNVQPDEIWNSRHIFADKKQAEYFLGGLDTGFMVSYAVGLYISGILGDRFNLRKLLTIGLCSSAISVFMFGVVSEWGHIYHPAYYMSFWVLNGLLQSSAWPSMLAVMGNWFSRSSRGLVLGVWSCHASVGNIIGGLLAAAVLPFGYEYAFLVPSCMLFAWGIVIFFGLVPSPREVGLPDADEGILPEQIVDESQSEYDSLLANTDNTDILEKTPSTEIKRPPALSFCKAVMLPGVIIYSLSYACLKLVNYAFFFWLPFYLSNNFGWSQAKSDSISIWYDVGGIIVSAIAGYISDRMGNRAPVVFTVLVLSLPSLYIYSVLPDSVVLNAVVLAISGGFINAASNMIGAAVTSDLGREGSVKGNKEALATVTGIVDGTGSAGAAIGQLLIPVIQLHLGWQWVFYFFLLMVLMTIICIIPMLIREVRMMPCCQRCIGSENNQVYHPKEEEPIIYH